MAHRVTAYVTNTVNEDGPAFAIREDNDETIYIPANTRTHLELEEMDEIEAVVIRNRDKPDLTPWFAVRVRLMDAEESE